MSYIAYGVETSKDYDLKIENIITIPNTEEDIEEIEINGGNNLHIFNGYKDIELNFNFVYVAYQEDFHKIKINIDRWLKSRADYLYYSGTEEVLYRVINVSISETVTTNRKVRRFTATFLCRGLKYLPNGLRTYTNNNVLYNWGTYESEPLIKVYGSGNITVNINGNSFTVKNIEDHVVIDSEIKECYKDNTNMGRYMTGEYPVFSIGKNNITWSGNITKVEVIPRWRCL